MPLSKILDSVYKKILTAESCFHLHKILDSVLDSVKILDSFDSS